LDRNVELVQHMYDLYGRGEVDRASDYLTEDVEWITPIESPDAFAVTGKDQARQVQQDWDSTWGSIEIELHDLTPVGDHVIAHVTLNVVGVRSGAPAQFEQHQVWTFRDGKVARMQMIFDKQAAHEAVGLSAPANQTTEANQ